MLGYEGENDWDGNVVSKQKYTYDYPMPSITVDVVYLARTELGVCQILFIKRKNPPFQDCLALPGGYMNNDETLKEAAIRELREETGIVEIALDFEGIFDRIDRDERGRVLSVAFYHYSETKPEVKAGDDAADFVWLDMGEVLDGKYPLAFDHLEIIKKVFGSY